MGHDHQTDTNFFDLFYEVFRNSSESVSEMKIFHFNKIAFIEKPFAKWKRFRSESKIVFVFETIRF